VTIGKHVLVHPFTNIGHDAQIMDYATLLTDVFIGGGASIGEGSQMNPKSMIVPHKKVGNNSMVGAGSVVMRNVKDNQSVHGNPAKLIKL
jgi:acetyltransferase-like isoleucine patch superfamily enzyme